MSHRVSSHVLEPEVLTELLTTHSGRKVGLLGGTFNPPHIGHLIIADQVKDQLDLEKILFIPSAIPPHQTKKETISAKHRLTMLEKTLEDNKLFEVNEVEINRGGKSYTYDTIKELKEESPDTEFYFIIGADMVEDLPNWYKIDELVQMVQFVAVNRPSYSTHTSYPVIFVDVPNIDISSTIIRQKVKDNCSINYLVTPETKEYIESEGLYKDEENKN